MNKKVTDVDLEAFVDCEFDKVDDVAVLSELMRNRSFRKRYCDLIEQRELLQKWWGSQGRGSLQ